MVTATIERGIEHRVPSNSLVPVGGKLPYFQELRTSSLLDVILMVSEQTGQANREKINQRLFSKTRPGFYTELNDHLHLAYADQRDGHGSQHWWRLFFDDNYKQQIEYATRSNALTVGKKPKPKKKQYSKSGHNAEFEWGGMYFRSPHEIAVAE